MARTKKTSTKGVAKLSRMPTPVAITKLAYPDPSARHVTDIFIDGVKGTAVINGVVRFHCFAVHVDPQTETHRATLTARLGMSIPTMVAFHKMLTGLIKEFQKDGVLADAKQPLE